MIGDIVLDAEPTKPAIGQIDLHFSAETPLRADRKHVAANEQPDHKYRIDRWSAGVGVIGRQLLVYPAEVEHCIDRANQMIRRHNLVQVRLVEELPLPIFPPTHHPRTPLTTASARGITVRHDSQRTFCNTFESKINPKRMTLGSTTGKIKGHANKAVGKVKQGVGQAVGNDRLRAKGAEQAAKGDVQKTIGKAKVAIKDATDKVAGKAHKKL